MEKAIKNQLVISILILMAIVMITFAACSSDIAHIHTYSEAWTYDEDYHWHKATCEHASEISGKEAHAFVDGVCSVCGYDITNPQGDPDTEYSITFDANDGRFTSGNIIVLKAMGNSLLSEPNKPIRSGYAFAGWAKEADGSLVWDFTADRVTKNITLYAIWLEIFNVTYDANGGVFEDYSNTITAEVKQGDTLVPPVQPERDNYVFKNWYKDSSLSQVWDFSVDTVTSDTTLYAGWESVIVEQEVVFVLNYAGSENVTMSTVDGLVDFVPTREGYVFNGWWISDGLSADGQYILAQKWDSSEIVTESNLILYAEWVEESTVSSQLPAPSVSINADAFSWPAIIGAVRYDIRVTKSGSNEELTSASVTNTEWVFPNGYDAGYYNVKIRAIGDGINTVNSVYVSKSYGHHILNSISEINFDITTSILTWTTVRNATGYELYINNDLVDTLTYTTFDMSDYDAGRYSIRIVATRNDYQSSTTSKTIEKLRLKTPELRLYFDNENNSYTIMWDSVKHADTYTLNFNGVEINVGDVNFYTFNNSASFWNSDTAVTLSMTAFDSNADYLISIATNQLIVNKFFTLTLEKDIEEAGTINAGGEIYLPQKFTVNFDLNGGSGAISPQLITALDGIRYPSSIPNREGYVFRGWYTNKNCTELYDFTTEINRDITLYAGWQSMNTSGYGNYVLDILSNYNTYENAYSTSTTNTSSSNAKYIYFGALTTGIYKLYYKNSSSSFNYGTYFYVYNATKGISLYSEKITNTSYVSLELQLDAGDVVYIRNYAYNSNYSATFSFYITGAKTPIDGGLGTDRYWTKGTLDSITFESMIVADYGTEITVTASTADNRYVFDGWYNGEIKLSDELSYTFVMPLENTTYTAKWIYYTLTIEKDEGGDVTTQTGSTRVEFNLNGAEGETPATQIITETNGLIYPDVPTRTGYVFAGWYETIEGSGAPYDFSQQVKGDMKLYAKWIRYSGDGIISLNSSMSVSVVPKSNTSNFSYYAFVPLVSGSITIYTTGSLDTYGYLYNSSKTQLKTDDDGGDGSNFKITYSVNAGTLYYIAPCGYNSSGSTILYLTADIPSDGGTLGNRGGNEYRDPIKVAVGEEVTITAQTNNGYTWVGWFNGNTKLTDNYNHTFTMPTENVTYTAKWIECPVTMEKSREEAGTVSGLEGATKVGEEVTITAQTNNGYTWVGWFDGTTKLTSEYSFTFVLEEVKTTLTAEWIKVTVEKNLNSAGMITELNNTYVAGQEVTLVATSNEGYTWLGWFSGDEMVSAELENTFVMPVTNVTYIAKWSADQFEITLDGNGGQLSGASNIDILMGETVELEVPTKEGCIFGGWFTNSDKDKITDENGIMISEWNIAEDTILIAQWLRTLTFNTDGGSTVVSRNVEPGSSITLPSTTRTGYTFKGWQYNSITYTNNLVMPDDNVTLTAQWKANTYYIRYNGTSMEVTYGQWYSIPTPTKSGYTFKYFTTSSGSRFSQSGYYNIAGNTSLSIKWLAELSRNVSGATTISAQAQYLQNGMTFTITYSGRSMKNFHIETNYAVNVTFNPPGWSYSNVKSKGINANAGATSMTITITLVTAPTSGTFTCKFTCGTSIVSGQG